jgi:hypothetical protein
MQDQSRGRDRLSNVSLGVIGDVNQQPTHGRGHTPTSNVSWLFELAGTEAKNTIGRRLQAG